MYEVVIILGLVLLNGVFSMSEIALVSARKSSLVSAAKKGSRSAKIALALRDDPDRFLSTVQIGITLIGILTGIYSGSKISGILADWLVSAGMPDDYSIEIAQFCIVAIVTYLTLVFGELLPKRVGMNNAEAVARMVATPMNWLSKVTAPFVWLLSQSTSVLFSLLGLRENSSKVTEDEIISIVNEGKEDGAVQEVEKDIVERVFLVGDLNVDSIMTHRRDIASLDVSMSVDEVKAVLENELHEIYPVVEGGMDDIKGIVSLKGLVLALDKPDFSLMSIIEEPRYFYCNMSVYKALETMKQECVSRGLVCDEFGTCVGIVTLKDMMMALVGDVGDEDNHANAIVKRKDKEEWLVDGQCSMHDFLIYFDCEDLYENEDYTTVAGLCLSSLDRIPKEGDGFEWHSFMFEVTDMDGVRIDKVLVSRKQ